MGYQKLTVTGSSSSSSSLPPYLDFYLMLDVSGSMGLPSTDAEQSRLSLVNPITLDNIRVAARLLAILPYRTCALIPARTSRKWPSNNYCMGYALTRVSQSSLNSLLNMTSTFSVPKQKPGLPTSMVSGLPDSLNTDTRWGLPAVSSCPADGTDACIQLRADAVGYAVNQCLLPPTPARR